MRLHIGNLSYSTTEETLRTLFSNYADVASVFIPKDRFTQQSKGFGFIEIEDEIKAQRAIGGMNGKDVDGRRIRVSEAVEKPRSERREDGFREKDDGYRGERGGYSRSYDDSRYSRRGGYGSDRRDFRSGRRDNENDYDSLRPGDSYGSDRNGGERRFSDGGRRVYGNGRDGSERFPRRSEDRFRRESRRGFGSSERPQRESGYSRHSENSDEY